MLAYLSNDTVFNHVNQLNATTMGTNHTGTVVEDVLFYPWGDQWLSSASGYSWAMPYRDLKTMTDITTARFYSPNFGRWFTADPIGKKAVKLDDPQTWNMYAYVRNNPATVDDPTGLEPVSCGGTEQPACMTTPTNTWQGGPMTLGNTGQDPPTDLIKELPLVGKALNWLVNGDEIALASRDLRDAETTEGKIGEGVALGLLVAINLIPGEGKAGEEAVSVYTKAVTPYVGITKDLAAREAAHGERLVERVAGLTRTQARGVEQAMIEQKGLANLTNKINSIAKTSPIYQEAVQSGRDLLNSTGFQW
jgi:RHS repeat-associated protein